MRVSRFLSGAVALALLPLCGAELIRNGSFEEFGGDGVPTGWSFTTAGSAPVTFSPATPGVHGERCLRVVNRLPKTTPHTFGVLTQMLPLKPGTDYTLRFMARGRDVSGALWAIGKGWAIRNGIAGVGDEWKEYSFDFKVPEDRMEGNGLCGLRLISEGPCAELEIDDVRVTPARLNLVTNGSFEGKAGTVPAGWNFRISNGAEVKVVVDDKVASAGKCSLFITNNTPRKAHVYGVLTQWVKLTSGVDYVLRLRAKGEGGSINLAVGNRWGNRLDLRLLSGDWKVYEQTFRLAPEDLTAGGNAPVMIISEGLAKGIWIDELTIEPKDPWNLPEALWQERGVYSVARLAAGFDGLKAIPAGVPVLQLPLTAANAVGAMPKPEDFSARVALAFDDAGLVLLAEVTDNTANPEVGENLWRGDSIQLRLDRGALRLPAAAAGDLEVGFSVGRDNRVNSWCWDAGRDPLAGALPADRLKAHGVRTASGYFLAARLDWKLLGPMRDSGKFGFTVVANDSDAPAHRAVYFLTPGLHDDKRSDRYLQAVIDRGEPVFWTALQNEPSPERLEGRLLLSHPPAKAAFSAELTDSTGKQITRELGRVEHAEPGDLLLIPFSLPLDEVARGDYQVAFKLNGTPLETCSAAKVDLAEQQLASVTELCAELERLKKAYADFYGDRPASEYVSAAFTILDHHLPRLKKRLEATKDGEARKHFARQAAMTRQDTREALADLAGTLERLQSGKPLPVAWKYHSAPTVLEGGWPVTLAVNEKGEKAQRPAVFTGYGHFSDIDRDIATFQHIGANVVQVELGPRHLFPREGKEKEFEPDFAALEKRYLPLLENAWKNNVKVALLISPHYHPAWLLKKYPELAASSGFFRYEVTHPKALEMLQAYIPALMEKLKASPYREAIHSICLSNEPVYSDCRPDNPYSAAAFKRFMEKKHGSVAQFNREAGRDYADYDALLQSVRKHAAAARYAFYDFSRETFAGWHRMLADEVKKAWPGMPVHTKIMVFASSFEYSSGVDPELMAAFSDYNGNDNYFHRRGRWIADWNVTALTHEIQISAKKGSVANTENHLIPDREAGPVANDFIYTGNFQQFITGASTLVTWVWADITWDYARQSPKGVFIGNIFLRPGNLVAHARAGLDGMRLAPELRKFFDYEPEAAILYPTTALLHTPGECRARLDELYTALAFTGYRVRFLTERQLARGDFGKTRLLLVTGAKNVSRAALAGMAKFTAGGGRIAAGPGNLTEDEYGNPVKSGFVAGALPGLSPEVLRKFLEANVSPLPVRLAVEHRSGAEGIFFRMVPAGDGSWLVNLVNYNHEPRKLRLEGEGKWRDLIADEACSADFELPPLKPRLLRFTR